MATKAFKFPKRLIEGLITSRPNRFLMNVTVNGLSVLCHCPTTGKIGSISFDRVPCLLSEPQHASERKTAFTVEAISLDAPETQEKQWIGINQGRSNEFVEYFVKTNALGMMLGTVKTVRREVKLASSRLDLQVDGNFVEVKTPLASLPCEGHPNYISPRRQNGPVVDGGRLIKHFADLSQHRPAGSRAILLMCHVYDAPAFDPPPSQADNRHIVDAAAEAARLGLEYWQINLRITPEDVSLLKCFPLKMFDNKANQVTFPDAAATKRPNPALKDPPSKRPKAEKPNQAKVEPKHEAVRPKEWNAEP